MATLGLGEFYACCGTHTTKVYAQPRWMGDADFHDELDRVWRCCWELLVPGGGVCVVVAEVC